MIATRATTLWLKQPACFFSVSLFLLPPIRIQKQNKTTTTTTTTTKIHMHITNKIKNLNAVACDDRFNYKDMT